jgi:hypothetical protein
MKRRIAPAIMALITVAMAATSPRHCWSITQRTEPWAEPASDRPVTISRGEHLHCATNLRSLGRWQRRWASHLTC